ncbi:two-component sensor histidine kinase [Mucilaginibacter sp. PPCGB 2223]|uniref:sensor histidine kinase n=1 Tax=Mucilaginibacter sp. PPCGB 2223 TaxID=1886027 RepID=UPI000825BB88|nr:HAMP domain-containing sensor histidine kinase [Mucilaginibacter sp. PPCGB 2223]OCX53975.1 two-component sensor histidine kinase [Mucilaginibacter sp. PPCGB 2223]
MKLLTKYNRVNLASAVAVLFVTGLIYYKAISYILNDQVDKDILIEEQETFTYVKQNNKLPKIEQYKDQHIFFVRVNGPVERRFINTDYFNPKEHEAESGRGLITSVQVKGQTYQVTIIESKVETEDLIRIIFCITIGVILFLLLVLSIANRLILNRIWQPFYNILQQLRLFSLTDNKDIAISNSTIDEFNELNSAVTSMASRVKTDYKALKTFTENASHELLTPIAVINSKLDSLIQAGEFNAEQSSLLNDVYDAVARLTRLNQSLLLLAKIENHLVRDDQVVDMKQLVENKINQFKELFVNKELDLKCDLTAKEIKASFFLMDVLLNNLIGNAIRHTPASGTVEIMLNMQKLSIKNTGTGAELPGDEIFKRFSKSANSEGSGLGLTISKQICESYKFELSYDYETPYHCFTVNF